MSADEETDEPKCTNCHHWREHSVSVHICDFSIEGECMACVLYPWIDPDNGPFQCWTKRADDDPVSSESEESIKIGGLARRIAEEFGFKDEMFEENEDGK